MKPIVTAPYEITVPFGWVKGYPLHQDGVPGAPPKPGPGYGFHTGVDIVPRDGRGYLPEDANLIVVPLNGPDGNAIYWNVGNRRMAVCHLESFAVVTGFAPAGRYFGKMGHTGDADGDHFHVACKVNGIFVNPLQFILPGGKGGGNDMIMTAQDVDDLALAMVYRHATEGDKQMLVGRSLQYCRDAYDRTDERRHINTKVWAGGSVAADLPVGGSLTPYQEAAVRVLDAMQEALATK